MYNNSRAEKEGKRREFQSEKVNRWVVKRNEKAVGIRRRRTFSMSY